MILRIGGIVTRVYNAPSRAAEELVIALVLFKMDPFQREGR